MKKIKVLVPVILIGLLINSCTGDLTEQTFSNVAQENNQFGKDDFATAIGPVYANIRRLGGNFHPYGLQEVGTDEMAQPANPSGWSDGGIYLKLEKHKWTALHPTILSFWNTLYQGVIHANRIINDLKEGAIQIPNEINEEEILSEIRTARAFYYWQILDNFGDAPLVEKSISESTELPSKTSREEIYGFVVNELTESIPNLNESAGQDMYGRFNKWAAKTLLAAVYLNAKVYTGEPKWNKCLTQVNDVINSSKYHLDPDYSDPFKVQNKNANGIIFAVPYDEIINPSFNIIAASHHAVLKQKYQTKTSGYGAGSLKMVPQFGAVYDSLQDKRYHETWLMGYQFAPNGDTLRGSYDDAGQPLFFSRKFKDGVFTSEDAGFRIAKWELEEGNNVRAINNDFPFFRYARVLMMKAEALLRTGQPSQAASIVTQVRMRAFDDPEKATVTAADLKKDSEINYGYWENFQIVDEGNTDPIQYGGFMDELGREFAAEMYRRRDMIRFGIYTEKSFLSYKPQNISNPQSRTVFPIPQDVVQSNPNLEQNPDYK